MKKKIIFKTLLLIVFAFALTSCKKDKDEENNYGKFTVTVKYDNNTVEGAKVHLFDESNGTRFIKTQTTNSQGITVFDNLAPSTYAFECDYDTPQGQTVGAGTENYELNAGENKHITIIVE